MLSPDNQVMKGVVEMVVRELHASPVGQRTLDVSLPRFPDAWFLGEDHAEVELQMMGPREIRACRRTPMPERLEEGWENGLPGHISKLDATRISNLQCQRLSIHRLRVKLYHAQGALQLVKNSRGGSREDETAGVRDPYPLHPSRWAPRPRATATASPLSHIGDRRP